MNNLLSDTSTYISIDKNPLEKLQEKTSKILKNLNENKFLKQKYHKNQLTLTSTVLPKCYGLPKIHKKEIPMRPIISLINSPTHFLAKVINEELKNSVKLPKSHINNSFELKEKLKNIILDDDHVIFALDVNSLFTNVPCSLVLDSLDSTFFALMRIVKSRLMIFVIVLDFCLIILSSYSMIGSTSKFMGHQWGLLYLRFLLT